MSVLRDFLALSWQRKISAIDQLEDEIGCIDKDVEWVEKQVAALGGSAALEAFIAGAEAEAAGGAGQLMGAAPAASGSGREREGADGGGAGRGGSGGGGSGTAGGSGRAGSAEGDQRQGLTLVHFSAQPEPFLTQNTPPDIP